MSLKTNTFTKYDTIGLREELSDVISNISPEDTPFFSSAGKGSVKNTNFEWQTDALKSVDTDNAHLEGDDIDSGTYEAVTPTVRLLNYVQISRKTVIISGSQEAIDKAGRKREMAYQMAMRSSELKRDIESICLSNQGAVAGNNSTARKTGTLGAFVKTNVNKASDGTDPVYTNIPTDPRNDGTQRPFTETILKDVVQQAWGEGANVDTIMVGPINKQKLSAFSGIAESRFNVNGAKASTIIGAADIYVSDFGNLAVVPNRFQRERDAWFLDGDYYDVVYLRPFFKKKMADTGDSEKMALLVEWGLRVKNEKALGLAADLTTTLDDES